MRQVLQDRLDRLAAAEDRRARTTRTPTSAIPTTNAIQRTRRRGPRRETDPDACDVVSALAKSLVGSEAMGSVTWLAR